MQLRNVLQMTTADDDLMAMRSRDIGLDSLISVDIRSWFLKNFEVSVPVLKIMGNDTMAELAELVASQIPPTLLPGMNGGETPTPVEETPAPVQPTPIIVSVETQEDDASSSAGSDTPSDGTGATTPIEGDFSDFKGPTKIDWATEIALPEAFNLDTSEAPETQPRSIVLTGVSGLLGKALLSNLLANPSVDEVICIATRRLDERIASGELLQDERVEYYAGDLTQPLLGLSEEDAEDIFSRADVVIHNGADTSHLKFYPEIKAANATSTKDLISLCMARKTPIHYLSTVGVALFGNYKSFPEVSVAQHLPPADGSHGYIAAKWASERMLEEAQKNLGLNVYIHRPSTIIREGADATNSAAQIDWMNALVGYMLKTKSVPSLRNLKGALDLVYLKNAASSILDAVFESQASKSPQYKHQVGDIVIPLDAMKEFVQKETGASRVDVLPVEKWTVKAVEAGLNRGIAALIDSMDDPGQPHYPSMMKA